MPVPEAMTRLTGITGEGVRCQRLDDDAVADLAAEASRRPAQPEPLLPAL